MIDIISLKKEEVMKKTTRTSLFVGLSAILLSAAILLGGCGGDDGTPPVTDSIPPVVDLTSPTGGEVVGGTKTITWTTTDAHPGTVEIRLSNDSGSSYPTVIVAAATDQGSYPWDTGTTGDGSTYRIQITATDLVGNVGTATSSSADFTVKNVPKVTGFAHFRDANINGVADAGDTLAVRFDLPITVNSAVAADLALPVAGDTLGTGATVSAGSTSTEIIVTLGSGPSLRSSGDFDSLNTLSGNPSGIDISNAMTADALENSGTGTDAEPSVPVDIIPVFVNDGQTIGSGSTMDMALGDVDGDGDLDLVEGNLGVSDRVYLNDGSGTFSDSGQNIIVGNNNTNAIALGDVDGDGDLDLAIAHASTDSSSKLFLNDGSGTFSVSNQVLDDSSEQTNGVILGDLDSDGDNDLLLSVGCPAPYHDCMYIYLNDGQGAFTNTFQDIRISGRSLADLDGDGDLDLTNWYAIWLNNGSGSFSDSGKTIPCSSNNYPRTLGDVDGDGDIDLVYAYGICLNDGNANFTASVQSLLVPVGILGDIDGDGDTDLYTGGGSMLLNDGSGIFTDAGIPLGVGGFQKTIGDVDGDGDLDIVDSTVWRGSLAGTN